MGDITAPRDQGAKTNRPCQTVLQKEKIPLPGLCLRKLDIPTQFTRFPHANHGPVIKVNRDILVPTLLLPHHDASCLKVGKNEFSCASTFND